MEKSQHKIEVSIKIDAKQHVFMLLFNEYQKDLPDFESLKKEINNKDVFYVAVKKLANENLIGGVTIVKNSDSFIPIAIDLMDLYITKEGYGYAKRLIREYSELKEI